MFRQTSLLRQALVALLCGTLLLTAAHTPSHGRWVASHASNGTRQLSYAHTATLLGKPTQVDVLLFCNPTSTKTERGMLGVELTIQGVAALKPFDFAAFEGPDAATHGKKLLRLIIKRTGKPDWVMESSPNGWTPDTDRFTFGFAQESHRARSPERAVLKALAEDADTLQLNITDPADRNLQLHVMVPVSGWRADFKALLAGLP